MTGPWVRRSFPVLSTVQGHKQYPGAEDPLRILQTSPHIGVLIVTMFEDDDSVFAAMRAGALVPGRRAGHDVTLVNPEKLVSVRRINRETPGV